MKFPVSIITINYNNSLGLQKTIESVLCQTYKDFEYIVIDGGSLDGSLEIIQNHEKEISYWVSEKDGGIYNAMNKGIRQATGKFVLFMNSGDFLYDAFVLENLIKEITVDDEILYGDVLLRNEKKKWERIQRHPEELPFSYFYRQTICQQACLIKRSLFHTIFFYNENYKICSDWEFFIYAVYIARVKTRKVDFLISIYDTTGVSGNPNFKHIATAEREQTIEKYFHLYKDDYKRLLSYSSPRFDQLIQIEKFAFIRKLVSIVFSVLLYILPDKHK
ncbi:glycosyltransferase [Flavobacterium sp. ZT3R18]|uniref:glycosyltransferase family 2 protein n=1 Tax=Flavobacterium sp. ZT3R18 TaxID=2594429 RepID=UPI00117AB23B|nr:glycosyltransferase family 2 protein [Flavobacterium sp. ZT3R18]TRX34839.1 glycosyltransferase [Flavobacterium sp. ZT3R18]